MSGVLRCKPDIEAELLEVGQMTQEVSGPSSGYSALPPPAHSLRSYTPSALALPPLLHFLRSCTSSGRALPPVPLPPVLVIAPDLTLVKSTSYPYLSSSNLVPFTLLSLLFLRHPCNTSSPFLLLLWFVFLPLLYFPVPGLFSCPLPLCPLSQH